MDKVLLVDGSNLLFQMFYGMPARIFGKSGKAIHGTIGFVGALLKIIRKVKPTHIAVLFDGEHENERKSLDSNYKANRIDYSTLPEEEVPFSQLPEIYTVLDYLKIKHAETSTCETDDWIAGYAIRYGTQAEIVISSFDSDYFQLISDNVSVLRYRGDKTIICTPDYIFDKFGISPSQYADYKALVGDNSDNIKGAEKVGGKTAALLLNKFYTLSGVIEKAKEIYKPSIRQSIITNTERLQRNYELIKLIGNVDLPFTLGEMLHGEIKITTNEVLKAIEVI